MTAAIVIRRATSEDLPGLGRLGALLVEAHHRFDPDRFIAPTARTPSDYMSFLRRQLDDRRSAIFVAVEGADVIGYTFAAMEGADYKMLRGPAGVIHDLLVDPAYRGRGAGRLLLEATLAHLRSLGAPQVVLSTATKNEAAQRLFSSMGFRRTMIEMTRETGDLTAG